MGHSRLSSLVLGLCLLCSPACSDSVSGAEGGDGGLDGSAAGGDASSDSGNGSGSEPFATGDGGLPMLEGLTKLRIEPALLTLNDDGVAPPVAGDYKAIGTFDDGERDVTDNVLWELDHDDIGSIDKGAFTGDNVGGFATVSALAQGVTATAELAIILELSFVDDNAPDGVQALFEANPDDDVADDAAKLRVTYPSDETMFPRNLERVTHQWTSDAALDRFEVRFDSDFAHLRFYTADKAWLPDAQAWTWIAATHAGQQLSFSVRGTSAADAGTIYRSQNVTLLYSKASVLGALYYWSTGAEGVLKATISSPVATKFFTDPEGDDDTCVSCHTVARNGRKLVAGYGGENLRTVTIPERDLLIPSMTDDMGDKFGWGTFNPPADRLLYSNAGALRMLDADNGDLIYDVELPTGGGATHPDWSPDGKQVAIAYAVTPEGDKSKVKNKDVTGSSIATMAVNDDGTLADPVVIVASADDDQDSLYFPSHSPDSAWLAYVHGQGKSKDNVGSELLLSAADGAGDPVSMTRLNRRVRDEDGVMDVGNSMPTWAPSSKPGIFWIAFSSTRAYGEVLEEGRDQLWGVAIDPDKIGTGEDPSYAAFWMPFQDMEEGNHRAFWAIDTEQECPTDIEICDNLDNDCDGIVDEDCCTPSPEVCGDGVDNDCDGSKDEGCMDDCMDSSCACGDTEICNNGSLDDDCDGLVDEGCLD